MSQIIYLINCHFSGQSGLQKHAIIKINDALDFQIRQSCVHFARTVVYVVGLGVARFLEPTFGCP